MAIMDLFTSLQTIVNERLAKDVRQAIHDGVYRANQVADRNKDLVDQVAIRQDAVEQYNNQMITEMTDRDVISAPEIIQIRDGESTAGARIDRDFGKLADFIGYADQYGFVADYEGEAQYDGLDSTRVTATDNTLAFEKMLDDAILKKNLTVYFPRGHYGIKTGNITKDLSGCTLTIYGDSNESTIIDFIKEDGTKRQYVTEEHANYIARINNADKVTIKDIRFKATTQRATVTGDLRDNSAVYYGSVWGLVFDTFDHLKLERVKSTNFNYRGISTMTTGATDNETCSRLVEMIDCEGFDNTSSGFWFRQLQTLKIHGGDFHHNGQFGVRGTGYGVTCNAHVGEAIITGTPTFHHNYRKGFDTHGCLNVSVDGAIFDNNVQHHLAISGWAIYTDDNAIDLNNVTFRQTDQDWLRSCYQALKVNGYTDGTRNIILTITDQSQAGEYLDTLKTIKMNNVKVENAYNGGDVLYDTHSYALRMMARQAELEIINSDITLDDWIVNGARSYSAMPITLGVKSINTFGTKIKWLEDSNWGADKGVLFEVPNLMVGNQYKFENTSFDLNNCYLFGRKGSAGATVADPGEDGTEQVTFINSFVSWVKMPKNSNERKYFGLVNKTYPRILQNLKVKNAGKFYNVPPLHNLDSTRNDVLSFSPAKPAQSDLFEVILDGDIDRYTLEIWYQGDYLRIYNDNIATDGSKITFGSRAVFVDADGYTKTRVIVKNKVLIGIANDYVTASAYGHIYSWGIEQIRAII